MRPLTLRLTNCRTFADLDLPIPEGVTAILGANGSGKSSLLNAIDVSLFAERGELAGELSYGEDALRIELAFEHGGGLFRVRRSFDGRGRGKSLLDFEEAIPGENLHLADESHRTGWMPLTLESIDATQARIAQTLGLTRASLHASAFVGQGAGDSFLDLSPAARKQALGEILALDVYRERHERAKSEKRAAELEVVRLRERAAGLQVVVDGRSAAETVLAGARDEECIALGASMDAENVLIDARAELGAQQAAIERVRTAEAEYRAAIAQVAERGRLLTEAGALAARAGTVAGRHDALARHGTGETCDRCGQGLASRAAVEKALRSYKAEAASLRQQELATLDRASRLPQDAVAAAERLAEARAAAGDATALQAAVSAADGRVRAARAALDAVRARIVRAEAEIERCQQAEVGLAACAEQTEAAAARVDLLILAEKMYGPNGIPVLVAENAIPLIEAEANRILALMPTADGETFVAELHTQREQKSVAHARETLDVVVYGDTGPRLYDADRRSHSGGESSRLRLAFALGLAALIARRTRVEFLVVDELPYLDTLGQEQLVAVLQSLEDTYSVVLLVGHEAHLASSFDQVITIERSGGRAHIVGSQPAVMA